MRPLSLGNGSKSLALSAGLILLAGSSPASPMKNPQRWVGEQKIDLTPLFQWWAKHAGERPLTAWIHVTGSIVQTNAWGWVVNARVQGFSTDDKSRSSGKAG